MGKKKAHELVGSKPKKKCCRKKTRCMKCPVVIHRLNRMAADGASKKDMQKSLKTVRANPARTRVA
ncbi:hypothetical protein [Tsukamurella serpentis]